MLQWLYPVMQGAFSHFLSNIPQIGGNEPQNFRTSSPVIYV